MWSFSFPFFSLLVSSFSLSFSSFLLIFFSFGSFMYCVVVFWVYYIDYDSKITCTYVSRLIFSTDNGEERSEDDAITTSSSLTIEGG